MRSALYAPGHSTSIIDSAIDAAPDAVIIDLEFGCPADDKVMARLGLDYGIDRARVSGVAPVVRINADGTEWFADDVAAVATLQPAAVLLPHASAESARELASRLTEAIELWCLLESRRDVLAVDRLVSSGAVAAVTIGYGDLCKELGVAPSDDHPEFVGVRDAVLAATARHQVLALDGVAFGDAEEASRACRRSAALGFAGRTLYSRGHVAGCNDAFPGSRGAAG